VNTLLLLTMLLPQGRPLFYWGAREPVVAPGVHSGPAEVAKVTEVHAALDGGDLVLRLTLDRTVETATHARDGHPVSGRLQALLYLDGDGDPESGQRGSAADPRTGAERLIEVGTLYIGEDEEEKRPAQVRVMVTISALDREGRRERLWSADHMEEPERFFLYGDRLEARVPAFQTAARVGSRIVYAAAAEVFEGRLGP